MTKQSRSRSTSDISWDEAIERVLAECGEAMHYTAIAEAISAKRWMSVANPAASVAVTLSKSLALDDSPFVRTGRGEYALKSNLAPATEVDELPPFEAATVEAETGALRAFGMYWQRDLVVWGSAPKLLGRQSEGAADVDFSEQVGVYLLHDRDRTLYVGRAADTLFSRLKAHTTNRLAGRWDRFSWFGLRGVSEDGSLGEPAPAWNHGVVIETLEALLIECLEPPLNRKRGDNFSAAEYIQVPDPKLEERKRKQLLEELMGRLDR